jgi:hyaluronate lyase
MKRTLIALAAAVSVALTAALVAPGSAAQAADEYDDLRLRWSDILTGGPGIDTGDPDIAAKITALTATAVDNRDTLDDSPTRTFLWSDLASTTVSSHISTSYQRVYQMALAYRTAGSALEGDAALRDDILSAVDWLHDNRYNATTTSYNNWFDWEVSTPQYLNNVLVLMYDDLPATQLAESLAAIDHFSPDPVLANGSTSAGANRVYKAQVVALRGVIGKSSAKVAAGANALTASPNVLAYVAGGTGFYVDGSYIDHGIAYTGGYGAAMLANLTNMLFLLAGSTWEVTHPTAQNVFDEVFDAFEPLMHRGQMMDMVRGREVSRHNREAYLTGYNVMLSIARLAGAASAADALAYRRMIKEWVTSDTNSVYEVYEVLPIDGIVMVKEIMADTAITPRGELTLHRTYARMDRVVHLRPDYAFGVSMFSTRTDNYESINSENRRGWYQAQGMTSLYTADGDQYVDGYWPTVNPYRLPGTTVDTRTRAASSEQGEPGTKTMVGGTELLTGEGIAAMDLDDNGSTLAAKKSWFMFDDEVVALGAGITSTDSRTIETVVDNRKISSAGTDALVVDGVAKSTSLGWTESMTGVDTVHLDGSVAGSGIGYYFPGGASVKGLRQARTGTWSAINTNDRYLDTTSLTRNYVTLWMDHGANPAAATYSYAVLPGATSAGLTAYAAAPDIAVLQNTATAQAVRDDDLGTVGAVFWTDAATSVPLGGGATLSSSKRAAVMTHQEGTTLDLAISDPTQAGTGTLAIELTGSAASVISADPGVTVTQLSPVVKVSVSIANAKGKTFRVELAMNP